MKRLEKETRPLSSLRRTCQRTPAGNRILVLTSFRYAIFELEHQLEDKRIESKILFILYAPDICDTKEKFLYATSKDNFRKAVQPFNKEMQVNDWADLDVESFLKILKF